MSKSNVINKIVENREDIISSFTHLVCSNCLPKLEVVAKPIKEHLDAGGKLKFKHTKSLVKVLCPCCLAKIHQESCFL